MWDMEDQELPEVGVLAAGAVLLRVEDAAARLGIHRTSMFRLLKEGEVRSVRVGRLRRVPVRCLDEYVDRLLGLSGNGPDAA